MPELPEVETVVRGLRAPLIGETIIGVVNDWPRHINHIDLPDSPSANDRLSLPSASCISGR